MTQIELPEPDVEGLAALGRAIDGRASRRSFASEPISIEDISTLLWTAQGITHVQDEVPLRASPSAGATYPLETSLSVAPGGCADLEPGLYRYDPDGHGLESAPGVEGSVHEELTRAALDQAVVRGAPVTIALAAEYDRTRRQYPDHGERYVHMEAGHAAQNVLLAAQSRGLNACPVGAFDDAALADALELPSELDPLYLVPLGERPTEK